MKTFTVSLLALCLLPVYFPFAENMMEQSLKQLEASPLAEMLWFRRLHRSAARRLSVHKVFLDMIGNGMCCDVHRMPGHIMGGPAAESKRNGTSLWGG